MAFPEDSRDGKAGVCTEKESVRKLALRARAGLPSSAREAKSAAVVKRIAALPEFRAAHTVMLYRAVRGELSLEALPAHPAAAGKRFVYPRCVSCPGTAFDDRGTRLGMGAGYYDRFLPQCSHAVVAMAAFEVQHFPSLPSSPRDIPLDLAVTEENLYLFPGRKGRTDSLPPKTVRVAAAVLCHEGRLFAARRGYGPWKDYWEFPGGKIEPGETPEEALAREIREELDTVVSVGSKLAQVEYDYPEFHLSMGCFACRIQSGSLTLKEHESARWLRAEELETVDWLPADLALIRQLRDGGLPCG